MNMSKKDKITVKGTKIAIISREEDDFISLTDMAGYNDKLEARFVIVNWMSTYYTLEYLAVWEMYNNPNFNRMGYHTVRNEPGRLIVSPKKWIEATNAIGIISKAGRYGGGVFAHRDIAFEFGTWLSAEFKFFLVKEFQRLKENELQQQSLEWNLQRTLSKINYRIHTDAIRDEIIPKKVTKVQAGAVYASEVDLLNVALFGMTAGEWRTKNPDKSGNMRDYATLEQLVVLSNMESINGLLIRQGLQQKERLVQLNSTAITQMRSLVDGKLAKRLE
ncbi:MAG: KilA-N domain-containing protein [Oscillospiraceae bacterium]|nr:KilA-N domain-containing protein [Oscillospiraceae bacterium]